VDGDIGAAGQRASTQLAAKLAQAQAHIEARVLATHAGEQRAAVDGAGPVRREVAGIKASQARVEIPGQRR
jgi:hypothetical protein